MSEIGQPASIKEACDECGIEHRNGGTDVSADLPRPLRP